MPRADNEWGEWDDTQWKIEGEQEVEYLQNILLKGVSAWNKWRRGNPRASIDFHGLNFSKAQFNEINFRGANLNSVNFEGACLKNANLEDANLSYANLSGADLSGANLNKTNFKSAIMPDGQRFQPKSCPSSKQKPPEQLEEPYSPCLQDFRIWYFNAREVGREPAYLDYIQSLALRFKAQTPEAETKILLRNLDLALASEDQNAMRTDADSYRKLLEQFAKDAHTILRIRGEAIILYGERFKEYYFPNEEYTLQSHAVKSFLTVRTGQNLLVKQEGKRVDQGNKWPRREDFQFMQTEATYLQESNE